MTLADADILNRPAAEAPVTYSCAHCALPVPPGLVEADAEHQFCCAGCRAVYETIHSCGLDSYYKLRDAADAPAKPAAVSDGSFESFDSPAFERLYVTTDDDGAASADLVLEGVACAACVWLVERLPRVLPGVIEARLSLREATVRVRWDPSRAKLSQVARALDRFGYTPHPAKGASRKELLRRDERKRMVHLGVAGAIMGNTMLLALALYAGAGAMEESYTLFFRGLSALLGVVSLAWPGAVFFRSAWAALRVRAINLDVPIALALLVGGVAGAINTIWNRGEIYFDSLTVLVFLLLVGRFMQYRQQRRADAAVDLLFSLTPSTVHIVQDDGRTLDAPAEALKPGDLVEVRSGELIPADGPVESGRSAVSQALLTGESLPVEVEPGDTVHAGAQNATAVIRVRVARVGAETRVGQLMRLVERGVQEKPAIVHFADKVGAWFTLAVSLVAAGTFAYWCRFSVSAAIDHTVALLIVTCPCVLGLATPLTIAIAIGRLARHDILVKSGAALERLSRGGRLLLDKTGTLTEGKLQLVEWAGGETAKPAVAAIEARSVHPIARALAAALTPPVGQTFLSARHNPSEHQAPSESSRNPAHQLSGRDDPSDICERNDGGISARLAGRHYRIGSPSHFAAQGIAIPSDLDRRRSALESAGHTVVLVAVDNQCTALAALGDRVRPDSAASVARLRGMGFSPSILSGDAQGVVTAVASQVGIAEARARGQVSPEQKLQSVATPAEELTTKDTKSTKPDKENNGLLRVLRVLRGSSSASPPTVMVGDGVNDAAALAAADVGVAVHGGAEASLAAADVYVARPGLAPLVQLAATARHAMNVVRRNLAVSLAYNLLAGALAATGMMNPLIAAIIMPLSSATVLSLVIASINSKRACRVPC